MDPAAERLPESIRRAGYELGDVTHVLLSHLHFDHCGWNTREQGGADRADLPQGALLAAAGGGGPCPPSQRARPRQLLSRRTGSRSSRPAPSSCSATRPSRCRGVKAVRAPGHNADMCIVLLDGGDGRRAAYWADLVPTAAHVPYPWIMGYDLYPLTTLENKKRWLPQAAAGDWLCIFEHDPARSLRRAWWRRSPAVSGPSRSSPDPSFLQSKIQNLKSKIRYGEIRWREKNSI